MRAIKERKGELLNKLVRFCTIGLGSLLWTAIWKSCTCTMSYCPRRWPGSGLTQSMLCTETFDGSHSLGGHCERSISKPSMWAEGGRKRARSTSQILFSRSGANQLLWKGTFTDPVPTPISAT
jgi:hypothetical protein